jgi:predicted dehydrogenase
MVRFGIIGTNWITERFLEAARTHEQFEITAVYSRTEERAREFASKYDVDTIFTDYTKMAASDKIDAVYIASPNSFHAEQAITFMKHKKHVLVEKPMASDAKEVKKMIEAARANDVVLMEAMKSTVMPNFLSVQKHIHKLGRIRTYFANYCQYSSRYDAYKEGTVLNAFNPAYSNGALMDLGVYTIYPLVVLFGKPNSVKASGYLLDSGADGQGSILLRFDEIEAVVLYSKITDSALPSEIHGEDATMIISPISGPEKVEIRYRDGSVEDVTVEQSAHPMYYEAAAFIEAIENNKQQHENNSWENSLNTMEIVDEARKQIGIVFPSDQGRAFQ